MNTETNGRKGRKGIPRETPYEVGYGRPPLHSRFKPGQSGNPRGRPKGPRSIDQVLRQALDRRVPDPRGGARTISMLELIVQSLVLGAAKRDPRMLRLLIGLLDRLSKSEAETTTDRELEANDREILNRFLASALAAMNEGEV
jgi:hypothetical protein